MAGRPVAAVPTETREQRIEAIMNQLRPKIEATVRKLVERAVDVPEAVDQRSSTTFRDWLDVSPFHLSPPSAVR